MSFSAFFGYLFIAGGPLVVAYITCIGTKSFLVLLSLASAFYWLVTLFIISALFRGFEPLSFTIGPYTGLVLVAVTVQEIARYFLWRFHKLSIRALQYIATLEEHRGASLTISDRFSLSFTHGIAHASVHMLFFCISWLPLSIGSGTVYLDQCPTINYYLLTSLITLAFAGILCSAMIVSFTYGNVATHHLSILSSRVHFPTAAIPSLVHAIAACVCLVNFAQNGCYLSIPVLYAISVAMCVWAGKLWWSKTRPLSSG